MTTVNVKHSSVSDEWMTPIPILERVKKTLGHIALDPASSVWANTRIGASVIYTQEDDGLAQDWTQYRTIFINPPGGKKGNKSMTALFWQKFMETRRQSKVFEKAIFLAFSIEAIQTTQNSSGYSIAEFPCCFPRKRIAFDSPTGMSKQSPTHASVIVYVDAYTNVSDKGFNKFFDNFSDLGVVR